VAQKVQKVPVGRVFVSVIMPCLNEEESIGACIEEAVAGLKQVPGISRGEIVVVDNGSTDRSAEEIVRVREKYRKAITIRLIHERKRGYGAALLRGFKESRGEIMVMGDSDGSYDFTEIPKLLRPILNADCDLVVGSRLIGHIERGAMPFLHRRLGTPVLTMMANRLFGLSLTDSQSGFRAIKSAAYQKMGVRMEGMEFASEMLARAGRAKYVLTEVPINYRKRKGVSKLLPMGDAWRHLRFLLLFSPGLFFTLPGIFLFMIGAVGFMLTAPAPFYIGKAEFDVHTLSVAGMTILLGVQLLSLSLFARVYAKYSLKLTKNDFLDFVIDRFQLEQGLRAGAILSIMGIGVLGWVTIRWMLAGFPNLSEIRPVIVGTVFILLGAEVFFGSFFLSFLRGEGK